MAELTTPALSPTEAAEIKAAVLDSARISKMEPKELALSLIGAFAAVAAATCPSSGRESVRRTA